MSNISIKSLLIVLGSLIIGLILGVLISLTIFRQMGPPSRTPRPDDAKHHMRGMIYRITDATEIQKAKMDSVLNLSEIEFVEMEKKHRTERRIFLDTTLSTIEPYLEQEQVEKLKSRVEYFRSKHKGERKGRKGKMKKRKKRIDKNE